MPERPEGVGDDWINLDCANPDCLFTVWLPPIKGIDVPAVGVCSIACAQVVLKARGIDT